MFPEVWSNGVIKAIFTEIQSTFSHLKYPDIYTINHTLEKNKTKQITEQLIPTDCTQLIYA